MKSFHKHGRRGFKKSYGKRHAGHRKSGHHAHRVKSYGVSRGGIRL